MASISEQQGNSMVKHTQDTRFLRSRSTLNVSYNHSSSPPPEPAVKVVEDSYEDSQAPNVYKASTAPTDDGDLYDLSPITKDKKIVAGKNDVSDRTTRHVSQKTSLGQANEISQIIKTTLVQERKVTAADCAQSTIDGRFASASIADSNDSMKPVERTTGKLVTARSSLAALKGKHGNAVTSLASEEADHITERGINAKETFPVSIKETPSNNEQSQDIVTSRHTALARVKVTAQGLANADVQEQGVAGSKSARISGKGVQRTQQKRRTMSAKKVKSLQLEEHAVQSLHATPPCGQQTRSIKPDAFASPDVVNNARSESSSPRRLLSRKRKPNTIPLVDEGSMKKVAVIAFSPCGPLNQGRSSSPPPNVDRAVLPAMTLQNDANDHAPEVTFQFDFGRNESITTHDQPRLAQPTEYNPIDDHPLAGYAQWLPSFVLGSPPGAELSQDLGLINKGGMTVSDIPDEDVDVDAMHLENRDILEIAETIPQIAEHSLGISDIAVAAGTVSSSETHNGQDILQIAETVPQKLHFQLAMSLPVKAEKCTYKQTGLPRFAPTAVMDTDRRLKTEPEPETELEPESEPEILHPEPSKHPEEHGIEAKQLDPESSTAVDDSGYRSVVLKAGDKLQSVVAISGSRPRVRPHRKHKIEVNKKGSPFRIMDDKGVVTPIFANKPDAWLGHISQDPFCRPAHAEQPQPHVQSTKLLRVLRTLHEESSSGNCGGATQSSNEPDEVVHNHNKDRSAMVQPQDVHTSDADAAALEKQEDILVWRNSLHPHQACLFNMLLEDAQQLVSQLARREELIQDRVDAFRQKGRNLVQEMELAHAQEYERFCREQRRRSK